MVLFSQGGAGENDIRLDCFNEEELPIEGDKAPGVRDKFSPNSE